MSAEKLIDAFEKYSNAILGFIVLQSLTFAYQFGTNVQFNCHVKYDKHLALGLLLHFVASTFLACWAIVAMSGTMQRLSAENMQIVGKLYWAKTFVIVLFAAMPVVLLYGYGFGGLEDYAQCIAARKPA